MGDEAGAKAPSLISCPCLDEGKFDIPTSAYHIFSMIAAQAQVEGGCARLVRNLSCAIASIGVVTTFADEQSPYDNRDLMAEIVAACLKRIVDNLNEAEHIKFGIRLRSIDIETFDKPLPTVNDVGTA